MIYEIPDKLLNSMVELSKVIGNVQEIALKQQLKASYKNVVEQMRKVFVVLDHDFFKEERFAIAFNRWKQMVNQEYKTEFVPAQLNAIFDKLLSLSSNDIDTAILILSNATEFKIRSLNKSFDNIKDTIKKPKKTVVRKDEHIPTDTVKPTKEIIVNLLPKEFEYKDLIVNGGITFMVNQKPEPKQMIEIRNCIKKIYTNIQINFSDEIR